MSARLINCDLDGRWIVMNGSKIPICYRMIYIIGVSELLSANKKLGLYRMLNGIRAEPGV